MIHGPIQGKRVRAIVSKATLELASGPIAKIREIQDVNPKTYAASHSVRVGGTERRHIALCLRDLLAPPSLFGFLRLILRYTPCVRSVHSRRAFNPHSSTC
jgi:hypothetical protein